MPAITGYPDCKLYFNSTSYDLLSTCRLELVKVNKQDVGNKELYRRIVVQHESLGEIQGRMIQSTGDARVVLSVESFSRTTSVVYSHRSA